MRQPRLSWLGGRARGERGQAALLALVGLVVLAIGMYTSYNLSRAVYEKVKLQNAADATAYSLATLEARTFNFVAFANRAQIASYVQSLEALSLLSNITFSAGMVAYAGDVTQSFGRHFQRQRLNPYYLGLAGLGDALVAAGTQLERQHDLVLEPARRKARAAAAAQLKRQRAANRAYFELSRALAVATAARLAEGAPDVAHGNDDAAELGLLTYALAGLNVKGYREAFDQIAPRLAPTDTSQDAANARRLMTELINASRVGTRGALGALVARSPFELGKQLSGVGFGERLAELRGASARRDASQFRDRLVELMDGALALGGGFVGTTKLVAAQGDLPSLDDTASAAPGHSYLSTGEGIVAKDMPKQGLAAPPFPALRALGFASVRAGRERARYCYYDKDRAGDYGSAQNLVGAGARALALLQPTSSHGFVCDDGADELRFVDGIQPYVSFAPRGRDADFGQPDVWVWLSKDPESMGLPGGADLDFTLRRGEETVALDARIGEAGALGSGLLPGMNAVARAQAYYHRPGAWTEPPNFFNPFWAARLAPKGAALERALAGVGLSGMAAKLVADNVWMF